MSYARFARNLVIWVSSMVLLAYLLHLNKSIARYSMISYIGIGVFTVLNIIFFVLADKFSRSSDEKGFLALIVFNFMTKLVVVIAIPICYYLYAKPESGNFVLPFIVIYVCFTIFETWFLNQKAVMRK